MFGRRSRRMIAAENAARTAAVALESQAPVPRPEQGSADAATTAPPAPPAPPRIDLSEERVFALVLERLQDFVGEDGGWTLVRRSEADTEEIFHDMAALTLARAVTSTLVDARTQVSPAAGSALSALSSHDAEQELAAGASVSGSGALDEASSPAVESSATDAEAGTDANDRESVTAAHITRTLIELDTVAVWADPRSHDPAFIDERLLAPLATPAPAEKDSHTA